MIVTSLEAWFDMTQPDLFTPPAEMPPMRKHSRTSRDAARKLAPFLTAREVMVLTAFVECGPSTPDAIAAYLNVDRTVTRPRCTGLATKGCLTVTGELRETGLGGRAETYAFTARGFEELRKFRHAQRLATP